MKKKLLALLFGATLVLGACGGGGEDNASDEGGQAAADPEKIFSQSCASCHGQNLEGGAGPKLSDIGGTLSEEEILNVIKNGRPGMAPNLIQGEDAEAVAKWLSEKK